MKILALDSSTDRASAAIIDGGRLLREAAIESINKGSEQLIPAVENMLRDLSLRPPDLDLLAVGLGPGSFSGLRGGLSFIKGLALAADRPVAGVSSLEALALNGGDFAGIVLPVIDAHRGEVFTACFRVSGDGFPLRETEDRALAPEQIPWPLSGPMLVLGNGLRRYGDLIRRALPPEARVAEESAWRPRAFAVGLLAARKFSRSGPDAIAGLVPLYVRRSDAELKLGPRSAPASLDKV